MAAGDCMCSCLLVPSLWSAGEANSGSVAGVYVALALQDVNKVKMLLLYSNVLELEDLSWSHGILKLLHIHVSLNLYICPETIVSLNYYICKCP